VKQEITYGCRRTFETSKLPNGHTLATAAIVPPLPRRWRFARSTAHFVFRPDGAFILCLS